MMSILAFKLTNGEMFQAFLPAVLTVIGSVVLLLAIGLYDWGKKGQSRGTSSDVKAPK
jgi:hypothetical protein